MTDLSLELIRDLLKNEYPDVTITGYEGAPSSNHDGYTSMVYRITLKGIQHSSENQNNAETPWNTSIIYKRLPENNQETEDNLSAELFSNEVAFYTKIWPTFVDFQNLWEISEPFESIPKCYMAANDCVILRDMKERGFVMPNRKQGLSINECYMVLKQLAQFHALSLAMKFHNPDGFYELINEKDSITEVFFIEDNIDFYRNYYNEAIENALSMVEHQLGDSPQKDQYLGKLREFCCEDTFYQTMIDLVKPREPLAVICHGDCWTNNFLFRYKEHDLDEMCILDFQMVRYASPALDLVYIMLLCISRDQRRQHQASLLDFYVDNLHARLLEMSQGETVFKGALCREKMRESIEEEYKLSCRFGLGIALDMIPVMTCDGAEVSVPPGVSQKEDNTDTSTPIPLINSNAACRKMMTELVQELVDEGLL